MTPDGPIPDVADFDPNAKPAGVDVGKKDDL